MKHSKLTPVTILMVLFLLFVATLFVGCATSRKIQTIPLETIKEVTKIDTVYLNVFRYDSTYVSHDLLTDRSHDTVLIKETNTQIKFQILRDTIERINVEVIRDSIPYEVRVTETVEVERTPTLFDKLCHYSFFFLVGAIGYILYKKN